jgi:hypothetical protein
MKEVSIRNFVIRNFVTKKVCILRNFVIKEVCTQELCNKGSLYQELFRNFVIKEVCILRNFVIMNFVIKEVCTQELWSCRRILLRLDHIMWLVRIMEN